MSQCSFLGEIFLRYEKLYVIWILGALLEHVETIGSEVLVSTWDTTIFVEPPNR